MKNKRDDFGDRMKMYESFETRLMPGLPIVVRLDGNGFSKYTRRLEKPYDERMSKLMISTTSYLMKKYSKIQVGYTQSDEISLIMKHEYYNPIEFDGRIQKLCSILSGTASSYFAVNAKEILLDNVSNDYPVFDCRIFSVPDMVEASNHILWRENDATKNSVQCAGQSNFSHKQMLGLSNNQVQEKLLLEKNINWNDYPVFFKRGMYIVREKFFDDKLNCERNKLVEKDFGNPLKSFELNKRLELLGLNDNKS